MSWAFSLLFGAMSSAGQQAPPADAPAPPITPSASSGATLTGTVSDQTGAVILGATVVLSGGSVKQTTTSSDQGGYTITGLPAGTYDITVSSQGFKNFSAPGVVLSEGQNLSIDALLEPAGEAPQVVNVEGQRIAQVETETAQVSGTITQKEIVSIGLNGRNFSQLIALAPGVSNQTGQDEAKVGVVGSVKYSVNGGRVEYNTFDIDGADVLNTGINGSNTTLAVYPSLDAIGEVKVLTSNYGAQYGRTASGSVLVTTKSGTENFHGNAYEFIRNEFFNSRNYFDQGSKAPLYRRNDFGFTLGGPLFVPHLYNTRKNKTFFFFSEEFRLERTPTEFNQGVASAAERSSTLGAGFGDFSDVCPVALPGLFASFTRKAYPDCPAASGASDGLNYQTFAGNQVPIDPNAQLLLNSGIIPLPTSTTGCNSSIASCYVATVSPKTYWREELARLDQQLGSKNRVSLRYIHDSWDTTVLSPQWGYVQNSFPTIQSRFFGPGTSMVARLTSALSPSLLNEVVVSYTIQKISLNNINTTVAGQSATYQRPTGLTSGFLFNNGFGDKVPGVQISGTNAAYGGAGFAVDPAYLPWRYKNPTFGVRDDASKVVGRHTLQFGVYAVRSEKNNLNSAVGANTGDVQGLLTFSNVSSFFSTNNSFADFLLGGPNRPGAGGAVKYYQQDSAQLKYYNRYWIAEPFLQDDWRITHRLTLNLGLRVSLFGTYHEKNLNAYNWDPAAFDPAVAATLKIDPFFGIVLNKKGGKPLPLDPNNLDPRLLNGIVRCGINGRPDGCLHNHTFNPAPRIGFAWDPKGDGKMSIRGGYGVFFHHGTGNESNTGSLEGSAPNVISLTQDRAFSYECIGGVGVGCGGAGAYPLNVTSIPNKAIWPYVQQWSFGIQRELPMDMVASVSYVGSKGTHLTVQTQRNQLRLLDPKLNPFGQNQPLTFDVCNTYDGGHITVNGTVLMPKDPAFLNLEAACYGTPGKLFPDTNSLRTFAPGLGLIYRLDNIADSKYHALQVTLRRSRGPLTTGVAYSYSHSVDDSSDRSDSAFIDAYNIHSNTASSSFDQRHLLNASYIYQLPLARIGRTFTQWLSSVDASADGVLPSPESESKWLKGWDLSGVVTLQSGTPFSIINGGSRNGVSVLDNPGLANGTISGSYPDIVGSPHSRVIGGGTIKGSFGPILGNPGAFAAPRALTFGNAGRNSFNNPRRTNFDMALLKHFKITEGTELEFRAEAFNVFNHTQFRIFNPDKGNTGSNTISCYGGQLAGYTADGGDGADCLTANSFLHPVDAHRPRTLQFGLKYAF